MDMTNSQREKCHGIIHSAAISGAGVAALMAQAPGLDNAPLVAIEVGMVISLGSVFGIDISEATAKGIIAGMAGTLVGRGVSQFLIGWVPILGNIANASTAAGVIESLGWAIASDFSNKANRC